MCLCMDGGLDISDTVVQSLAIHHRLWLRRPPRAVLALQQGNRRHRQLQAARRDREHRPCRARRVLPLCTLLRPRQLGKGERELVLAHDKELPVSCPLSMRFRPTHSPHALTPRTHPTHSPHALTPRTHPTRSASDIDILCHLLAPAEPTRVSSFGSLSHFRRSAKPKEAGDATRCIDCPVQDCPYDARKSMVCIPFPDTLN